MIVRIIKISSTAIISCLVALSSLSFAAEDYMRYNINRDFGAPEGASLFIYEVGKQLLQQDHCIDDLGTTFADGVPNQYAFKINDKSSLKNCKFETSIANIKILVTDENSRHYGEYAVIQWTGVGGTVTADLQQSTFIGGVRLRCTTTDDYRVIIQETDVDGCYTHILNTNPESKCDIGTITLDIFDRGLTTTATAC